MNGMEMLLQSFGVNTEEVKANVESAVALVRLMNEQLAHLKESVDRIEAKQGQQTGSLATIQSKMTDLDGQVMLLNEWTRREEWPPQVTQTLDGRTVNTGKYRDYLRDDDAGRTEGTASNSAANRGSGRG